MTCGYCNNGTEQVCITFIFNIIINISMHSMKLPSVAIRIILYRFEVWRARLKGGECWVGKCELLSTTEHDHTWACGTAHVPFLLKPPQFLLAIMYYSTWRPRITFLTLTLFNTLNFLDLQWQLLYPYLSLQWSIPNSLFKFMIFVCLLFIVLRMYTWFYTEVST